MTQSLKFATACLLLILGAFALPSLAQQTDNLAQPFSPGPYRVGERLTYNISFSSFVSAAHVELLVAGRGTFFGRDGIQLKGHVETTGVVNAALFAINNDYITYVDPATGLPYHGQQTIREASRTARDRPLNSISRPALLRFRQSARPTLPGFMISCRRSIAIRALPLTEWLDLHAVRA